MTGHKIHDRSHSGQKAKNAHQNTGPVVHDRSHFKGHDIVWPVITVSWDYSLEAAVFVTLGLWLATIWCFVTSQKPHDQSRLGEIMFSKNSIFEWMTHVIYLFKKIPIQGMRVILNLVKEKISSLKKHFKHSRELFHLPKVSLQEWNAFILHYLRCKFHNPSRISLTTSYTLFSYYLEEKSVWVVLRGNSTLVG